MRYYLAPSLAALRNELNAIFPKRDKTTDGWIGDTAHSARKSDHNPDWDNGGIVRAIDVDKDLGIDAQTIVDRLVSDPRVAYVIFRRRIWQNPAVYSKGGWHVYTPTGKASWFNPHEQHFHVSIRHGARWENDTSAWLENDDMTDAQVKAIRADLHTVHLAALEAGKIAAKAREDLHTVHLATLEAGKIAAQARDYVRPITGGRNALGANRPASGSEIRTEIALIGSAIASLGDRLDRLDALIERSQ